MKKIFFSLLFLFAVNTAFCQAGKSAGYVAATDSANGTTPLSKVFQVTDEKVTAVKVQVVVSKVSGTVSGTAILYESLNGTDYDATGDTLTLTNQATNKVTWLKTNVPYSYLKVVITNGSGAKAIPRVYFSIAK